MKTLTSADATASRQTLKQLPGINRSAVIQLHAQGIDYVDQIFDLPGEKIREMVRGDKSFGAVMTALGRKDEGELILTDAIVVRDDSGAEIGRVPSGTLRQIAALRGTARALGFDSPADLGAALSDGKRIDPQTGELVPFGYMELARYRIETENNAKEAARAELDRQVSDSVPSQEQFDALERQVQDRVDQYSRDYDVTDWVATDFQTLRNLAFAEMRLESVQRSQARAISGSRDAEAANKIRTEESERLINIIGKLKDALQISLKARAERRASTQADQVITDLSRRGKQLMKERMLLWQCCGVLQLIAFPIFPDCVLTTAIRMRCTRCGKEHVVNLVTQEMLDVYVQAGSFIPEDAPPDLFRTT